MNDEETSPPTIHRYGLRLPKGLFDVVSEIAWDSRRSINLTLVEFIRRGLVDFIERELGADVDHTHYRMTDPDYMPLKYTSVIALQDPAPEEYEAKIKEIDVAFLELLDWFVANYQE